MDELCHIRPASLADLGGVVILERASFTDPWTAGQLAESISDANTIGLVAEGGAGAIAGYLLARVVLDEAEILSVAVGSEWRRHGLGRRLLDSALETMGGQGVRSVWLEVRPSNEGALALYRAARFVAVGRRRSYYRRPVEDALVLRRELSTDALVQPPLR